MKIKIFKPNIISVLEYSDAVVSNNQYARNIVIRKKSCPFFFSSTQRLRIFLKLIK